MKKVVINKCYGGFGLSDKAYEKLIEWGIPTTSIKDTRKFEEIIYVSENADDSLLGTLYWSDYFRNNRSHPLLIKVVEELGEDANGHFSELRIVEIPDDVEYIIEEYDGMEWIAEVHRTWG